LALTRISGNEDWRKKQEAMGVLIQSSVELVGPKGWGEELVDGLLWEDEKMVRRGMKALRKASMKTKGILGAGEDHVRRLWYPRLAWR